MGARCHGHDIEGAVRHVCSSLCSDNACCPFIVVSAAVGLNGMTARPGVLEQASGRLVKVFRRPEEHLAYALAERPNAEAVR